KVMLDDPMAKHLPVLADLQVLDGFDAAGKPILRAPRGTVMVKHLLTHTAGFAYDNWDAQLKRYLEMKLGGSVPPLVFHPGPRWEYGTNIDWAGRLVERISGETLEDYFQQHVFRPLGMPDTSFILPAAKFDRLVDAYTRAPGGKLEMQPRRQP